MISRAPNELECDMAQTYGVLNMKALPPAKAAVLACGLGPDSRTMRTITKTPTMTELLLAAIADKLSVLIYGLCGDKNTAQPKMILDVLIPGEPDMQAFDTPEAWEAARAKMINQMREDNGD